MTTAHNSRMSYRFDYLVEMFQVAVFCYFRQKGHMHKWAIYLSQCFFDKIILGQFQMKKVDCRHIGLSEFIFFLLRRYDLFFVQTKKTRSHEHSNKQIKTPKIDSTKLPRRVSGSSPQEFFHHARHVGLLEHILSEVKNECRVKELTIYWEVFNARYLSPISERRNLPSLQEISDKYGIGDNDIIAMTSTIRCFLQSAFSRHLTQSSLLLTELQSYLCIL